MWTYVHIALAISLVATQVSAQNTEYEYVIIGSGPGGGSLAANLARAGHSVFLIEAGEDHGDSLLQRIPSFSDPSAEDPTMSWHFFVEHYEDREQAYRDSKYTWKTTNTTYYIGTDPPEGAEPLGIFYPRAGTLGGCGNHNAMNLALPPDNDWNNIGNLTGDATWNADYIRRLLVRIENNDYIEDESTPGHGFEGWLHSNRNQINLTSVQPGFLDHIQRLFQAIGTHSPNSTEEIWELIQRDLNRVDSDRYEANDIYQLPLHYDSMRRRSSAQTYLRDTINELNDDGSPVYPLTISTASLATSLIFDNDTESGRPRAIGVNYLHGASLYRADRRYWGQVGRSMNVTASREVIVAGGTFNTPQILKLSGIGPRAELESFGIPVLVDLPAVGENMQDNYEGGIVVEAAQSFGDLFENCTNLAPGDPCLREWEQHGTGPYGIAAAPISMLHRSSRSENADADLFFFGAAGGVFEGLYPGFSIRGTHPPTSFFWSTVKMQTQNRAGSVRLRSADPQDTPIINFNYFSEGGDHDLQAMSEGMQFVLDVFNSTPAPYGPFTQIAPNPNLDIRQAIRDEAFSHHATSSCVMGPDDDVQGSCVDSKFRVHGVDALRVVDASVFPRVPGGFPIMPTFLLSEKAFDTLLEDLGEGHNATMRSRRKL